jgi:hypothetical protein
MIHEQENKNLNHKIALLGKKATLKIKAYEMRLKGMSYRQIAQELGITFPTAHSYVKEVMNELNKYSLELIETYRDMELTRLDAAQNAIYKKVLKGDDRAITTMLKIQERRARVLGLDAPVKTEATIKTPEPIIFVPAGENEPDSGD